MGEMHEYTIALKHPVNQNKIAKEMVIIMDVVLK